MARGVSLKLAGATVLTCIVAAMFGASLSWAAPYCLLRKPYSPQQGNCFQFYLADAAVTAPRTMAVIGAAGCAVTDYAARQGWLPDGMVPGPHATAGEGDAAMGVVSPYFGDAYECRAVADDGSLAGPSRPGSGGSGTGCVEVQTIDQAEERDESDALTVEAAIIHVMNCPGNSQVYLYEYLNRTGFRVINPPNWSKPVGGRDFGSIDEALSVAATGRAPDRATGATGEDGSAPAMAANLTWLWEFRPVTFNGQFSGSTKKGWTFNGTALYGAVGTVSCTGSPTEVPGVESGGGGRMECTAQFPASASSGGGTWRGTGQGRIDYDGFLLKAGGSGVIVDAAGTNERGIENLYLRPGLAPAE